MYLHGLMSFVAKKMAIPLKVDILHGSSVYFRNYQVLGLTIPHSIQRVHLLWQGILLVQVLFQLEHIQSYVKTKQKHPHILAYLFTFIIYHTYLFVY